MTTWNTEARRLANMTGRDTIEPLVFPHLGRTAITGAGGHPSTHGPFMELLRERINSEDINASIAGEATTPDGRWCLILNIAHDPDEDRFGLANLAIQAMGIDAAATGDADRTYYDAIADPSCAEQVWAIFATGTGAIELLANQGITAIQA